MAHGVPKRWSGIILPLGGVAVLGILLVVMMSVPPEASTVRAPMQQEKPAASPQAAAAPATAAARDRASSAPKPAAPAAPATRPKPPQKPASGANAKSSAQQTQPIEYRFTSTDGREWSSAELRGKVVFVDFWATWCGPCVATIPELARLARAFPDDVVVIGVSKEPAATVTSYMQGRDIPYPCVSGPLPQMPYQFRTVRSIPTIFVIDREGRVATTLVGRHTFSQLSAAFRAADTPPAAAGG